MDDQMRTKMTNRDFEKYEKLHKKLWNWLFQNPEKMKSDWPLWKSNKGMIENVKDDCFACVVDWLYNRKYINKTYYPTCSSCPVDSTKYAKTLCIGGAPYFRWCRAKSLRTKKKWAKIIAELPWIRRKKGS